MELRQSKRLAPLEFFEGSWRGVGKGSAGAEGMELHFTLSPELGGDWYVGQLVLGDAEEVELEAKHVWGYDPLEKKLVRTFFDSSGLFGTVRSSGWDGDRLVWEGEAITPERKVAVRQTIERKGPDAFEATWEAQLEGDAWTVTSIESLERDRDAPGKFLM